jgi:hypothetical protein
MIALAPAGGEGLGEGEAAPTAGALTQPSPCQGEGGANIGLPVNTLPLCASKGREQGVFYTPSG